MKIRRKNTHIEITDYDNEEDVSSLGKLAHRLSIYDKPTFTDHPILVDWNESKRVFKLYANIPDKEIMYDLGATPIASKTCDEFDNVDFKMKNQPRNTQQTSLINFISGRLNYEYTFRHPQVLVNVDTAFGKTFCTINALSILGYKFMIIVPASTLVKNWEEEIIKHTDMTSEDILVLNPSNLKKLNNGDIVPDDYKGFIMMHTTITSLAGGDWSKVTELFKTLRIGVKVFDEIHKNFRNMVLIDLHTNTFKSVYLSATVKRSDRKQNEMFTKFFHKVKYFGKEDIEKKEPYIRGVVFRINTMPIAFERDSFITNRGGMIGITPTMFAKYLIQRRFRAITEVLDKAMKFYSKREYTQGRCLILISNIEGQKKIKEYISGIYPDMSIKCINSNTPQTDRSYDTDVIISSTTIMGTGVNIPDLIQTVMLDVYSSEITAEQIPNRLREIEGVKQVYMELYDKSIPESVKQFKTRYKTLSNILKDILYVDMGPVTYIEADNIYEGIF
ncbi:MAG: DEAD/DEAH box helicase family protein [Paraclostridium sp.]